jgi:hypothetical protein
MTESNGNLETPTPNPLFPLIDKEHGIASVRELISHAVQEKTWDLPEDPEELKKVLSEAVDHAVLLKKPQ